MYDFIDITESQTGNGLPSEAINVNGEYIEEHLPGYRTLLYRRQGDAGIRSDGDSDWKPKWNQIPI